MSEHSDLLPSPIPGIDDVEWDMLQRGDMLGPRLGAKVASTILSLSSQVEEITRDVDRREEALHQIAQWAKAYPLKVFPEPDFAKARALLDAGGMTLDAISASNMRHVVEGVGQIARTALASTSGGGNG